MREVVEMDQVETIQPAFLGAQPLPMSYPEEDVVEWSRYRAYDGFKRAVDVTVAAVGLVLCAPLFVLVAVAVKLDSHGPVFFRQVRVGRNRRMRNVPLWRRDNVVRMNVRRDDSFGRLFTMIKFRTMGVDAEAAGPQLAQKQDPRVTRVGRFLRDTRLDELPQLWNVLVGDMTLIGPRPERPEFVRAYAEQIDGYALRHLITPGITGLSQVKQGYDKCLDDVRRKVAYDLHYIRHRSLGTDLSIMASTVAVVFDHFGAL